MRYAVLSSLFLLAALAQNPYNEKPSYGRSRDFDLQHIRLELSFDLPAQKLFGIATLRMTPLSGDLTQVSLDSANLDIESVTLAGRALKFQSHDEMLDVTLDRPLPSNTPVEFTIRYHAQPKRGLFFVFPDKFHPKRPRQIWANGDTAGGNNRFWFPGYDFPNDKATSEMIVTVPAGWESLSNGKLAGVRENKAAQTATFDWVQDKPMSTYLISLVAGEFDKGAEKWQVPVEFYVPKGKGADIPRTFGRTTQMLDFFSSHIVPYPWAKYSQAMVDTFGGGMENTSATTEGAYSILTSEQDFEDRQGNTDSLIAHEMAHQWFGDLVTCADWRHTWLNEGFATYFEDLWEEHAHGRDEYDWLELKNGVAITSRPAGGSVVPRTRDDPDTAYGLIYNKGGWTLHMVRGQLGDARFWKAIQHYAEKFSYQTATTGDFVEAINEATGRDLEWLFDQYVYKPGHPEFEVSWDYDERMRLLHVAVRQTQKVDGKPAPFDLPIEIEVLRDSGVETLAIKTSKESEDYYFGLDARPRTVLFDPRDIILKRITFKKPELELIWQLQHASRVLNRAQAADALGFAGGADAIRALERAGTDEQFYGIRVDAAEALGRIKTEEGRAALLKMLADSNFHVRSSAATALGQLPKNDDTVKRLFELAKSDKSDLVRRSALGAAAALKPDKGLDLVKPFLSMESPNQNMRAAAVGAMATLGDEAAVPTLLELCGDENDQVRQAALRAFGKLGKDKPEVMKRLLEALDETTEKGDRYAAIQALSQRKDAAAIEPLERRASIEPLPNIARQARDAAESIRSGNAGQQRIGNDDLSQLRKQIVDLEKENGELKVRVDRLEKK